MTLNQMLKLRKYAQNLGYKVVSEYSSDELFCLTFPNAIDKFHTVLDFTYDNADKVALTHYTDIKQLIDGDVDDSVYDDMEFPIEDLKYNFIKEFIDLYWRRYKKWLVQNKLDRIENDF